MPKSPSSGQYPGLITMQHTLFPRPSLASGPAPRDASSRRQETWMFPGMLPPLCFPAFEALLAAPDEHVPEMSIRRRGNLGAEEEGRRDCYPAAQQITLAGYDWHCPVNCLGFTCSWPSFVPGRRRLSDGLGITCPRPNLQGQDGPAPRQGYPRIQGFNTRSSPLD